MPFQVNIAATAFTLEPIETSLKSMAALAASSSSVSVSFAGFDSAVQTLVDPTSVFYASGSDSVNVLMVRAMDLTAKGALDDLKTAVQDYDSKENVPPLVIVGCPQADKVSKDFKATLDILSGSTSGSTLVISAGDYIATADIVFDEESYKLGYIPYSTATYSHLASTVARGISYLRNPTRPKLVVCDCDNTLWQGVAGTDDPKTIVGNAALHKVLKRAKEGGLLLALCSKSNDGDIDAMFKANPKWDIKLSDFVARRVTFDKPKSELIKEMLAELNLTTLTSVVFVDDNDVEIADVEANAPGVVCMRPPMESPSREVYAHNMFLLDCLKVTETDKSRSKMYEVEAKRQAERAANKSTMSFGEYIE
ncbi:hypothetical protein TeGR_g4002, partial [Tetraparma gracilis]